MQPVTGGLVHGGGDHGGQDPDQLPVVVVGGRGRRVRVLVDDKVTSGKARQATEDRLPPVVGVGAGDETRGGDRARVDHRIRATVGAPRNGLGGVERQAGGAGADQPPGFVTAEGVTDQRVHKRLGHAHDRERVVGVADGDHPPVDCDQRDPEQRPRHCGERGIHLGHLGVVEVHQLVVGTLDHPHDLVVGRQVPGRDEGCRIAARLRGFAHPEAPGPQGMSSKYQPENSRVHTTVRATKYGSMRAMTVPIPERWS